MLYNALIITILYISRTIPYVYYTWMQSEIYIKLTQNPLPLQTKIINAGSLVGIMQE